VVVEVVVHSSVVRCQVILGNNSKAEEVVIFEQEVEEEEEAHLLALEVEIFDHLQGVEALVVEEEEAMEVEEEDEAGIVAALK
jgi:hypothetical protein